MPMARAMNCNVLLLQPRSLPRGFADLVFCFWANWRWCASDVCVSHYIMCVFICPFYVCSMCSVYASLLYRSNCCCLNLSMFSWNHADLIYWFFCFKVSSVFLSLRIDYYAFVGFQFAVNTFLTCL